MVAPKSLELTADASGLRCELVCALREEVKKTRSSGDCEPGKVCDSDLVRLAVCFPTLVKHMV